MACQMQSYKERAPISHWETIFCSQGSPSRPPVPTSSHPALNNSDEATPPHLPQPEARADLRWWNSFLSSWNGISLFIAPEMEGCRLLPAVHQCHGSLGFGAYLIVPGSEATGSHTSSYPSAPYHGRNYSP